MDAIGDKKTDFNAIHPHSSGWPPPLGARGALWKYR